MTKEMRLEKIRDSGRKWKSENPEKVRENGRKYYARNSEKIREKSRNYYANNLEKVRETNSKYRAKNRVKAREQTRKWKAENPEKVRAWYLKYEYDITPEDYSIKLKAQNNLCAICAVPFNETPHIDHCHTTKKVRGLLCDKCNIGLGMFKDSASVCLSAAAYLQKAT